MQITRGTDAGLRVLMVLAHNPERQTTVEALSTDLAVPRHHLAKVVQSLSRHRWVATSRGRGGGIIVTSEGLTVDVATVVAALEGTAPVVNCHDPLCPLVTPGCALQSLLGEAQGAFMATLASRTIADLVS